MHTARHNAPRPYGIELFPLADIRPTEHCSDFHADSIRREIELAGLWTHPILIDSRRNALMDGHHRHRAAGKLGLTSVPVIRLSYDDPAVRLESWRPGETYTPETVWAICENGDLLPVKSTRHVISAQLPFSRVPLARLRNPEHIGESVSPAAPQKSRVQLLTQDYHAFGARLAMRTVSAAALDLETPETIVPHAHLRLTLASDPAMAALLPAAPCRIALGTQDGFPFRLAGGDLLLLPPSLLRGAAALAAAARWGMEAACAVQARETSPGRLAALLRHGAALLRALLPLDLALILSGLPARIAGELTGSALEHPSPELLVWFAGCLDVPLDGSAATVARERRPLDGTIEQLLVSQGDSRLAVNVETGRNRYGTTPRPRPEAVHFSSSTASSISDYGYLFCDVLRRDLQAHLRESGRDAQSVRADLSEAIHGELCDLCGLEPDEADGAIAPSGTDTELLAVLLARAAEPDAPLVNILISPEETGRGVGLAGAGQFFDPLAATGAAIGKGAQIWPEARTETVSVAVRDPQGEARKLAEIDAEFLAAGCEALATGARVLAHVLSGSKTGLSGPSNAAVETLRREAPDRVDVVVDACQMRLDPLELGDCVRRGWMVQVSGSKSLTGPPFSGALLFPTSLRGRAETCATLLHPGICHASDWSRFWSDVLPADDAAPQFGAAFRWLPALLEAKLFAHVPQALRDHALQRFRAAVEARIGASTYLRPLPREVEIDAAPQFTRDSILAFEVLAAGWDGALAPLPEPDCRKLFELLNCDASALLHTGCAVKQAVLSQEFHIGQPVALGEGADAKAVLRLVVGMRFFNIVGHAGPGSVSAALESEIADLSRAIDKLEILAANWWRIDAG